MEIPSDLQCIGITDQRLLELSQSASYNSNTVLISSLFDYVARHLVENLELGFTEVLECEFDKETIGEDLKGFLSVLLEEFSIGTDVLEIVSMQRTIADVTKAVDRTVSKYLTDSSADNQLP